MGDVVTEQLWVKGNLSYKLHSKQKEIYAVMRKSESERMTIILAARRFGKSYISAVFACEEAIRNPNSKVIILAPNKAQAYSIYSPILKSMSEDAPYGFVKPTKSEAVWHVGNSELVFAGFDTIADALRGGGTILVIVDEAGSTNSEIFEQVTKGVLYHMLQKTIGKKRGRQIYVSTPAETPDHPWNLMWEKAEKEGKLHKYTIYDNPILTLPEIEDIARDIGGKHSNWFRRECLCENVRDLGGLIIPEFTENHILNHKKGIETYPNKWIIGDMGGQRDKTVFQVFGRLLKNEKLVIIEELVYPPNTHVVVIGNAIRDLKIKHQVANYHVWLDAQGQTLVDLASLCSVTATLPPKSDADAAVAVLNAAFYKMDIFVSDACPVTIGSLYNCSYNAKRTDYVRTEAFGHADAIMAAVYGYRVAHFVELGYGKKTFINSIAGYKHESPYKNISKSLKTIKNIFNKS